MTDNPVGSKIYLQPVKMVHEAIRDIVEIQRAKVTNSEAGLWSGKIHYVVRLYGVKQEYRFSIDDIEGKRCNVRLEVNGQGLDRLKKNDLILRQFALLDSMLTINANTELDIYDDEL